MTKYTRGLPCDEEVALEFRRLVGTKYGKMHTVLRDETSNAIKNHIKHLKKKLRGDRNVSKNSGEIPI